MLNITSKNVWQIVTRRPTCSNWKRVCSVKVAVDGENRQWYDRCEMIGDHTSPTDSLNIILHYKICLLYAKEIKMLGEEAYNIYFYFWHRVLNKLQSKMKLINSTWRIYTGGYAWKLMKIKYADTKHFSIFSRAFVAKYEIWKITYNV